MAPTVTRDRKSLIAGVGVLIFTVILAGVAVTAHNTSEPEPEWLMVMNAETGEFQPAGDSYTLTLEGVDAEMLAFTDRPEREAQTWDTSAFLDYWANEFGDDPPNAVVSADGVRVVVTLRDPRVGMGEVTFTATHLGSDALHAHTFYLNGEMMWGGGGLERTATWSFNEPGEYEVSVVVDDGVSAGSTSMQVTVTP